MNKIEASADRLLDILDNVDVGNLSLYDLERYVNMLKNISEVQVEQKKQEYMEKALKNMNSVCCSGFNGSTLPQTINELQ